MSDAENRVELDLFGDPVRRRREGPGRPEHQWTLENSNKINLMFAMGGDPKEAADAIGVSVPTLRKHYFSEVGARRKAQRKLKATQLALLAERARAGDTGAIKLMLQRLDKAALDQLAHDVAERGRSAIRERKPPPVGKKEAARAAAADVTGLYEPPPAPLLN